MSGGNHHAVKVLTTPDGDDVEVDELLAPVVEEIWRAGIDTMSCCQDAGDFDAEFLKGRPHLVEHARYNTGYAYIDFADHAGAAAFLNAVADAGPRGAFYARMTQWSVPGAWRKYVHYLDDRQYDEDDRPFGPSRFQAWYAQVTFPASDIKEIARRLRRHNRLVRADPS